MKKPNVKKITDWLMETGFMTQIDGQDVAWTLGENNRLTVLLPEAGKTLTDYGLKPDGTGCLTWPDGHQVWSSVDYVHHKDAHLHRAVADELGLMPWKKAGTAWA